MFLVGRQLIRQEIPTLWNWN